MNVYRDETFDSIRVRRGLSLPLATPSIGQSPSLPGSIVYQPTSSSLLVSNGRVWTPVGGGGGGGSSIVIGPGGGYATLLEALQDGVSSVTVETSFTDASIVDAATMPSNLLIYILPGIVYSYTGTMDISSKRLIITGEGRTSVFRVNRTTTPYTSNGTSSILCMDCMYSLGTTYDDSIIGQYITFDTRNTMLESLNPAPTQPMLTAIDPPSKMTLLSTTFIGSSATCRLISATSSASIVAVNTRFLGTFTSSTGAGAACVDTVSENSVWRSCTVETVTGITFRVGGRIEQVSGQIGTPPLIEVDLDGTVVFDCRYCLVTPITSSSCSVSLCSFLSGVEIGGNLNSLSDIVVSGTLTLSGSACNVKGTTTGNSLVITGDDVNVGGALSFVSISVTGTRATLSSARTTGDIDIVGDDCQLTSSTIFGSLTIVGDGAIVTSSKNLGGSSTISGARAKLVGFDIDDTLLFTPSASGGSISNSSMDTLQLQSASMRVTTCNMSTLSIDVDTSINTIITGSTISSTSIVNAGGGVATDPLFVGNRVPDPGATNIAPASIGNQF